MKTFYVKQKQDGRVYMSSDKPTDAEIVLRTVKAKDWKDARSKIMPEIFTI